MESNALPGGIIKKTRTAMSSILLLESHHWTIGLEGRQSPRRPYVSVYVNIQSSGLTTRIEVSCRFKTLLGTFFIKSGNDKDEHYNAGYVSKL
jgi:hypothetical protein